MEYKSLSFGLVDHIANDFSSEVNNSNNNSNSNNSSSNSNIWYFYKLEINLDDMARFFAALLIVALAICK